MSKFKLDKIVTDIANFQRLELKRKSKIKKKKDITIKELERELEKVLNKLIEKDNKEISDEQ